MAEKGISTMRKHADTIVIIISIIIMIACIIGMVYMVNAFIHRNDNVEWQTGTYPIDWRITYPNNYEILYRTTYKNGLTAEYWVAVTREDYFSAWRIYHPSEDMTIGG